MITLRTKPNKGDTAGCGVTYHVAGRPFHADRALVALAPLCQADPAPMLGWPEFADRPATDWRLTYRGEGRLAEEQRNVECRQGGTSFLLLVPDAGRLSITRDEQGRSWIEADLWADAPLSEEVILGPALSLALALQGIWCLHASAIVVDGAVIAFIGESGMGKSTLAAFLGAETQRGWRPAADDILPIGFTDDGLCAFPHFPQLKLSAAQQPWIGLPQALPVQAICLLASVQAEHATVDCDLLEPRSATLALIRHTVAARLFGGDLLAQHLAFCTEVAAQIPVYRLTFARQRDALPKIAATLTATLNTTPDK